MGELKNWKYWLLVVVCIISFAIIGCNSMIDRITPAEMPKRTAEYVGMDPNIEVVSLRDAKIIKDDVLILHRNAQLSLLRFAQDDELAYKDALAFIEMSIEEAQGLQDIVVGTSEQPFSVLGILAGLTGGAAIGKVMKRKGDYSPAEFEAGLVKAKAEVQS